MSSEFLTHFKEAGQSVISTRRPWSQFLSFYALSLPHSLQDASARVSHNLAYFLFNYTILLFLSLILSLLSRPFPLILVLFLLALWYFLYFSRDEPLNLFNLVVLDDRAVVLALAVLTLVVLLIANVWFNLVVSLLVGAAVIFIHAVLRGTEDLVADDTESPYGPMLSGGANAGSYAPV
ncbi:PRA1 family protein D [Arachis duranensis]|uniref:PRA1 family protein n=2 Tax=Arachis TaxID=3817 RepID=A0A445BIC2_ARAHY|nr:PRA1 family protein D [Arachis duranensis]XP_025619584.1 PRA1 family protein D [Arachis hypogaea]XP_057732740.1 PRA1 family protein D [Arachis stenosperma]QHO35077.1 PRA1 family protein D [Arachis hypogaea]RYR38417.1 hypothetical protein Ahy_A09g043457 [Arachis hypogaea]